MSVVTVLGASGTVSVPFKSATNHDFGQSLASQISAAVTKGTLFQAPLNQVTFGSSTPTELVLGATASGGAALGNAVVGLPSNYTALVDNTSDPVTVTANNNPVGAFSVLSGVGGLTFIGGTSSVGGTIALGGGKNTVAGTNFYGGTVDSTDGGLRGNWVIGSGGGATGSSDIVLATGNDTVFLGANDTIDAGGANVLAYGQNTDGVDPTFFIGSGDSTVFGEGASNLNILGNGSATGGGLYELGTGGNGVIAAGAGNTTLVGGGNGDILYANTTAGAQAVFYGGTGNETLQAGSEGGSSTLYGGSGNQVISGGKGNDVIEAGKGADTIYTSLGNDSVYFTTANSAGSSDLLVDFDTTKSTIVLKGYTDTGTFSQTSAGLQLKLSDNTTITFANLDTTKQGSIAIKLT